MSSAVAGVGHKRGHDEIVEDETAADATEQQSSKRARREENEGALIVAHSSSSSSSSSAITAYSAPVDPLVEKGGRTSSLPEPNYLLSGHQASVLGGAWSPSGKILATCSRDRSVLLWRVEDGEEPANFCQLVGHKNAVLGVAWGKEPMNEDQSQHIYTASADQTAGVWDVESGERIRKLAGHNKPVNAIASRPGSGAGELVATASDDGTCKLWDCRSRNAAQTFNDGFPQLAVALADDGTAVFAAGVEGTVKQWDVRKGSVVLQLTGHRETVTGLSLSPDGNTLLSFSMDNALRAWDVRPFFTSPTAAAAPHLGPGVSDRCVKLFVGASNNFEAHLIRPSWSGDGTRVTCGSADRCAYVWEFETAKLLYALPGHQGVVTAVPYHPTQPVIASCGTDKKVWLGELVL